MLDRDRGGTENVEERFFQSLTCHRCHSPTCETETKCLDTKSLGLFLASFDTLRFPFSWLQKSIPYLTTSPLAQGVRALVMLLTPPAIKLGLSCSDSKISKLDFTPCVLGPRTFGLHLHTHQDPGQQFLNSEERDSRETPISPCWLSACQNFKAGEVGRMGKPSPPIHGSISSTQLSLGTFGPT